MFFPAKFTEADWRTFISKVQDAHRPYFQGYKERIFQLYNECGMPVELLLQVDIQRTAFLLTRNIEDFKKLVSTQKVSLSDIFKLESVPLILRIIDNVDAVVIFLQSGRGTFSELATMPDIERENFFMAHQKREDIAPCRLL